MLKQKKIKSITSGAGIARLSLDMEGNDDDWRGAITEGHRSLQLFGTFYF